MDFRQFLELIYGDQTGNIILVKSRRPGGAPDDQHDFRYPEQLDDAVALCGWSNDVDLYLSPSVYGDKTSPTHPDHIWRNASNALTSRVLYSDTDTFDPTKYRVTPSIVVNSSKGRTQAWWILDKAYPTEKIAELCKRIAYAHSADGNDKSSWSANKIMRIPGSKNTKSENPKYRGEGYDQIQDVTLDSALSTFEVFSFDEISDAYSTVLTPDTIDYSAVSVFDAIGDQPEVDLSALPDPDEVFSRIPPSGADFRDMLNAEPRIGDGGNRSELRWAIIMRGRELGLSAEDIASVVWASKAGSKWWHDSRGLEGVLYEIRRSVVAYDLKHADAFKAIKASENVPDAQVSAPRDVTYPDPKEFRFFSEEEESLIDPENFIDRYIQVAQDVSDGLMNEPYYRLGAITLLATAFGAGRRIMTRTGYQRTSIFGTAIGQSTTGKSNSTEFFRMMREGILRSTNTNMFSIPSKGSEDSLSDALRALNGGSGYILDEEAGEVFRAINDKHGYMARLGGVYLRAFDGRVQEVSTFSAQSRRQAMEDSGESLSDEFSLNVMFYTTPQNFFDNINADNFETGLLARFIWYIGHPRDVKRSAFDLPITDLSEIDPYTGKRTHSTNENGLPDVVSQFVSEIGNQATMSSSHPYIRTDPKAAKMLADAHFKIVKAYESHPQFDKILSPSFGRMRDTAWRLAGLESQWRDHMYIQVEDMAVALREMTIWFRSLFYVIDKMADSAFSRINDDIVTFIGSRRGKVSHEVLARQFGDMQPNTLKLHILSLTEQGRIVRDESKDMYILREDDSGTTEAS